jgi:hypothetical protein
MDPFKNLSSKFIAVLNTAANDNVINRKELDALKESAGNKEEREIVGLLSKDHSKINFQASKGNAIANFDLSTDFEQEIPEAENKVPAKLQPFNATYSSLGEGDKSQAVKVENQATVKQPTGDPASISSTFNTPEKVAGLLGSIPYDKERGKPLGGDGPLGAKKPEDTLKDYSGVCRDIHQLGAFLLAQNGYEAIQMGYVGAQTSHSITIYKPPGGKGYGIVEYGKVYSPETIQKLLGGRYATSPEEAVNALNFGGATAIYKWTPPKEGEVGHVEGIFYTSKFKNYHKTLELEHNDRIVFDRQLGAEIEKTLSEKWSIKGGINFDSPGDPTAAGAPHISVGYKTGNENNWFSMSMGAQYRPNDGSRRVGTLDWAANPTFLMGANFAGQVRPINYQFLPGQFLRTTIAGNIGGAFLALNSEKKSDAGSVVNKSTTSYDVNYISTLPDAKLKLREDVAGTTGPFSYNAGLFYNHDTNLMVAAMGMGGKNPLEFANIGVDGRIQYSKNGFNLGLGAAYLFRQVNNLDNTAVCLDSSYTAGKVELFGRTTWLNSVEGNRFLFNQGVNLNIHPALAFTAQGQEEIMLTKGVGVYTNSGSNNATLGLTVKTDLLDGSIKR